MSTYRMVYHGSRKISALKAVRRVCGIGLKEAKAAVDNEHGFIIFATGVTAILAEYASQRHDGSSESVFDWAVGEYDSTAPVDLRGLTPHMDAVLSGTRAL